MESANLNLAFLPLAFALLLCSAVCTESLTDGGNGKWCIAKPFTNNERLRANIDYSCSQSGVDCKPIQPGGSCFQPDTPISHASYAMNLFYKAAGKHPWNCHFDGTGIVTTQDPSFGTCTYPLQ